MSPIKFFLLLLSLVLVFSLIPSVNAIIEKEYQYEISPINSTSLWCLFKVRFVIETAQDGTWHTDSSYKVFFYLEITYFNETHFEGDKLNFTGGTEEEEWVSANATTYYFNDYFSHLLVNSPTNIQMTTIRFFTTKNQEGLEIYPELSIKDAKSHEIYDYTHNGVVQNEKNRVKPILIDIKSTSTTPSSELIFLATGTIFGMILIGAILMVKRRKKIDLTSVNYSFSRNIYFLRRVN